LFGSARVEVWKPIGLLVARAVVVAQVRSRATRAAFNGIFLEGSEYTQGLCVFPHYSHIAVFHAAEITAPRFSLGKLRGCGFRMWR
jgi:hypothetical protein